MSASFVALLLLSIVAPIGAFDVLYFHLHRFRLFARPASRLETVTHVVRSALIGSIAILLSRWEPHGAWFWLVAVLVVLDFANNLADVWLEPASRADLGGVPRLEYLVHVVGATASGAVGAAFLLLGHDLAALPTELHPATLPPWLASNALLVGAGGWAIALVEGTLVARSWARAGSTLPVPT